MILKASKRCGATALALHLLNEEDNDHIELHELRGFSSDNLEDALNEIRAVAAGTRCQKFLFSLSLSPPEGESVPVHIFENTLEKIEKKLGLEDQPRAIVFHEKEGRRHAHCVWSRIDADNMKAIDMPHFKMKLRDISKQLYLEQGWEMPRGFLDSKQRDPENFTMAEWQQAKRTGEDPKAIKAMFQECWAASDTGKAFITALEERGFYLAKGDGRPFVALDYFGEVHSLTRAIGVNTKELQARLGDPANLPSVAVTRENLARRMTKALENHQTTVRDQLRKEAEPILRERLAMRQQHREEREKMKEFHDKRKAQENKERADKMPRGLPGIWHRITGKYQKARAENEAEAKICDKRDREQKQFLVEKQLQDRQKLQDQYKAVKNEHNSVLQNLREHTAHYLKLGRAMAERPRNSEIRHSQGNQQSRSNDKGRDKEPQR